LGNCSFNCTGYGKLLSVHNLLLDEMLSTPMRCPE
jgi:hypothetical protein